MIESSLVEYLITIVISVVASTGFWSYVMKRTDRKNDKLELLKGLAHDRIIHVGTNYINRGWLTYSEYEDFMNYLYLPYTKFGGNGLATKIVRDVKRLPMRSQPSNYSGYTDELTEQIPVVDDNNERL